MPQHPTANHRLSALAQAHKRLERNHRQLADSFNHLPAPHDLTLTAPSEPIPIVLLAANNRQYSQPLTNYFNAQPPEATLTATIDHIRSINGRPSDFTATLTTSDPPNLNIAAASEFLDHIDIQITATATYAGQTATATATFRVTYEGATYTLEPTGNNPATRPLNPPNYTDLIDLRNHFAVTPTNQRDNVTYSIYHQSNHPNLSVRLTNYLMRIKNTEPHGWSGHQIVVIEASINNSSTGETACAYKTFRITTGRAPATLTIRNALTPSVQYTLTDGGTDPDHFTSPLPLSSYFTATTTLDGTPTMTYTPTKVDYPLAAEIIEADLPGTTEIAHFLKVTDRSPNGYNNERYVDVTATATLQGQTATRRQTFILTSPAPPGAPTLTLTATTRPVTLDPENNWTARLPLTAPGNPTYTPPDASLTFTIQSDHNLTTDPQVYLDGNNTAGGLPFPTAAANTPPHVNIAAKDGTDSDWTNNPRNVIVRANVTSGGLTAHQDITYPVTYDRLILTTLRPIPTLTLTPGAIPIAFDARSYYNINAGPGATPTTTLTTQWRPPGASGITLTQNGTRLTLAAPASAAGTLTYLQTTLRATHETETHTAMARIPIQVDPLTLTITREPANRQTDIYLTLNVTNSYQITYILPPNANSSLWEVAPSTATTTYQITDTHTELLNVGSYGAPTGQIAGSITFSNTSSHGWIGSEIVELTLLATSGAQTAQDTYRFHVRTTKPPRLG